MLISSAHAQAGSSVSGMLSGEGLMGMLPIILMFVLLYFLMIRPQMKRQKEHKAMIEAIAKGDEVVIGGGLLGRGILGGGGVRRRRSGQLVERLLGGGVDLGDATGVGVDAADAALHGVEHGLDAAAPVLEPAP